uniref:Uncharacterized protein n=1 Tax=Avena sativa TaxID=4498 RepID=A0ACD5WTK3_AVESA
MSIFRKLATDRNNCRVMCDTPGLVSNIMVPITSDLLHNTPDDHGAWSAVAMKSLEVMSQFVVAPGEIGAKLRREISSSKEAVSTLQRIFCCNKCNEELQQRAIKILTRVHMDSECNRREFVSTLVEVFTQDTKYSSGIKGYAGCALSEIFFHGGIGDAKIVIQKGGGEVVDSLTKVLIHEKNKVCRQAAAEILEHLCTHYTKDDDEYLGKAMTNAMPQILGEIICWGDETHNGKEADQNGFPKPVTDIESQSEDNGQDKGNISPSLSHPQINEHGEDEKESVTSANSLASLLSFCGTVYDMGFISDLPPQWDTSRFLNKLKETVLSEKEIDRPMVENLLLCKAIGKMVISMMKHSGSRFVKQPDLESFIEALSSASKKMRNIDCYMAFRSTTTSSKLDRRTLASFVKEAQEVYAMLPSSCVSGRSPMS